MRNRRKEKAMGRELVIQKEEEIPRVKMILAMPP
jgi:hypothetical protein